MKRIYLGIFLVAMLTLITELTLTRLFDVILTTNLAYLIITCTMFSFGLSGIYATLRPFPKNKNIRKYLAGITILLAFSVIIIPVALNLLPFNFDRIDDAPFQQMFAFLGMYLSLIIPFFLSGLVITLLISAFPDKIQPLYFWDLAGAATGCIVIAPLLPKIGPGGILTAVAILGLLASGLFTTGKKWITGVFVGIILLVVIVSILPHPNPILDFSEHQNKRGVLDARRKGAIEFSRWDPISKIDVVDISKIDFKNESGEKQSFGKHIAYDGGSQSSFIYPFDGDFAALRSNLHESLKKNFYSQKVIASHYLKRDRDSRVLIIGAAGGSEIKAALMYGAAHVDAVEMVATVVDLGKKHYADYNGNIFNHPKVRAISGEGRSFLRSTREKYDIIQMYSNHTTSSIASGTGAMATVYLQTVEAYKEYFTHLTPDGVLHINHYTYPRMIATAARAWKDLGRDHFVDHVVVVELNNEDFLPTFLVKMSPWTEDEIAELKDVFYNFPPPFRGQYVFSENPLDRKNSFLSKEFFSGELPEELVDKVPYRVSPSTDNHPFFAFLRKSFNKLKADPSTFTNTAEAAGLNWQRKSFLSLDTLHLFVTGAVSIFFGVLFIVLPLVFSSAANARWQARGRSLVYFACLGAGFIIFELVLIQIFMQFIGSPLYTYSTVIFVMLLAAGTGSFMSRPLKISPTHRWFWPFAGIIFFGIVSLITPSFIFHMFLGFPFFWRVIISGILIFPLGFFLGMPFPLGILWLNHKPRGAITWAWGLNGLFTVIGGLMSVLLALFFGFRLAMAVAVLIYLLAFVMFAGFRRFGATETA